MVRLSICWGVLARLRLARRMIGFATCSIRVARGRDVLLLATPRLSLLPNSVFQIHETAMAAGAARRRQYFRDAPPQPGDEQVGGWLHAQLVRMDNRVPRPSPARI